MSQQFDEQGEQQQEQEERESLKDLRAAADDGRKARRELAFVKAGIDTDTPLGAMFATAYAGDLSKDAIAEEWAKIAPQPPSVEQEAQQQREQEQQVDEEQQQQAQDRARRSISSTPAEPVSEPTVDPLVKGYKEFHQNMGDGLSREKAAKPVFEAIIGAAVNGDERFIWDGKWTDDELEQGRVSRA